MQIVVQFSMEKEENLFQEKVQNLHNTTPIQKDVLLPRGNYSVIFLIDIFHIYDFLP